MGITTLDVVLPNPDKISEFKDPLLQWEKVDNARTPSWIWGYVTSASLKLPNLVVDNARTPSWRQDLLLEVEPEEEELDHWQ